MASTSAEKRTMNIQSPPWTKEEDEMFDIYPEKLPPAAERTIAEITNRSERAVNQRYHILRRRQRESGNFDALLSSFHRKSKEVEVDEDEVQEVSQPQQPQQPAVISIATPGASNTISSGIIQALAPQLNQPQQPAATQKRRYNRADGWTPEEDAMMMPYLRKMPEEVMQQIMADTGRTRAAVNGRWSKLRNDSLSNAHSLSGEINTNTFNSMMSSQSATDIHEIEVTRAEKELLEKIATVVYNVNGKLFTLRVKD